MFRFQLVAPTGTKFDDQVYEVILPTIDGQIGVLAHHMPLVSVVINGVIIVRHDPRENDLARDFFAVSGGAIIVESNTLKVLVDEADHARDINEAEAKEALERALQLKAEAKDQISLEKAQSLIDRSNVRLKVASLKRHHQK
ncbi:MAG: ATP synthase F1 subunit epsilon [Patescibacteria group bacterium]|jgi:F-type H+-transporting ATPase subunit epsilon|nr:ATP synthase F1 subunit epsilon [Patescibacteria group bacterium]